MPDLSNYTGNPPNAFAMGFIHALEAAGFTVAPTGQGPIKGQRKTLRIFWRSIFIGLMNETLWEQKIPYACLYRFPKDKGTNSVARAPLGFDKDEFARRHGCAADQLHVYTDSSGSYLWVQDQATGLRLMQHWAKKIDDVFLKPM
jgi:5-methylcytosine-specific restriction protein A